MAKSAEDVVSTTETVLPPRPSTRAQLSPELSPKTGNSELAFDDYSFDSPHTPLPPFALESEILEIRQCSEAVCRSTQESLNEFRACSSSVKRKILAMERQITSLRSSFVDASKSGLEGFESALDGKKEQAQLTTLMKELQAVQDLLNEKEREFEKREKENAELKQDLSRLEQLISDAAKRRNDDSLTCECRKCALL